MGVSSSFTRQPINVSGNLENHIIVYDMAANAPATATAAADMQGVDMSNYSDNFSKATITLADSQGNTTTHDALLLPNSSERYNFAGRFVKDVTVAAVDEPTTAGVSNATALVAAATAQAGLVDINFIEA